MSSPQRFELLQDKPVPQVDQALLDNLNVAAEALLRVGLEPASLRRHMAGQIKAAELATGQQVIVRKGQVDGRWFCFSPRRPFGPSYAKTTKPNQVRFLNARVDGVLMTANFQKPDTYDFENHEVAAALRRLADIIERADERLADVDVELSVEPRGPSA